MIAIFVYKVKCGMSIDQVPEKWREAVREIIEAGD